METKTNHFHQCSLKLNFQVFEMNHNCSSCSSLCVTCHYHTEGDECTHVKKKHLFLSTMGANSISTLTQAR